MFLEPEGYSNAMNLDEAQRKQVADWIAQGLKLSEIQNRLYQTCSSN